MEMVNKGLTRGGVLLVPVCLAIGHGAALLSHCGSGVTHEEGCCLYRVGRGRPGGLRVCVPICWGGCWVPAPYCRPIRRHSTK